MLHFIIAEAAIELVPKELAAHVQVVRDAKRRGKEPVKILLDSSKHWEAMEALAEKEKRGRPDITHFCLLSAMESVANKAGEMRITVHTRNDEAVRINPETRLPRVYERFCGLVEDVFEKKKITARDGKELLALEEKATLASLLSRLPEGTKRIVFDPAGKLTAPKDLAALVAGEGDFCIVAGGFAHGKFSNEKALEGLDRVSLSSRELAAWTAVGMATFAYEYSRELEKSLSEPKP